MTSPHLLTYRGETNTITGWGKKVGIRPAVIYMRLGQGWTIARALTTPVRPRGPNVKAAPPIMSGIKAFERDHLAMKRQLNRTLRLFIRQTERQMAELGRDLGRTLAAQIDLHALMGRGVVSFVPEKTNDRASPVTRDFS